MADNEIKIKVETDLKDGLKPLLEIANQLPLGNKDKERISNYNRQAELALSTNDLKSYQKAFNSLVDYVKTFISNAGGIPEQVKKLDNLKTQLNKEIDDLAQKSDKISQTKLALNKEGRQALKKEYAEELFKNRDQSKYNIKGLNNRPLLSREETLKKEEALAKELQSLGKTWQNVTKELAQKHGFYSVFSAQAAHRYFKPGGAEEGFLNTTLKTKSDIDIQRQLKEQELEKTSTELDQLYKSVTLTDTALGDLFKKVSDWASQINIIINQKKARKRKEDIEKNKPAESGTNIAAENIKKQNSTLGQAFKQFTLYAVVVRAARSALREAVSTVKELDKYLTEQAMVTGKTREETYALVNAYQELALQTGATTKEIASVATEYMKQGKSTKDALILTEAAVKAAKVARVSVGDSVNYLTTALNGFRLSAEDAMRVSDKFAAVAASSATDYDELAIALSKVASQANLAGMSIDYTTALLTKGLETTREAPETMGTALKTIIARMREMKDYGATLEGDTDINNVESQLAYVGIALKNQQGELRSTEEVLDELGKKWDTLNKNQQAALAKALAGTRQQSRLIAMMDDYERVTELQEIAQRSAGATSAQAGTYLEGMEAALNKIQVAWEKIVTTLTNSDVIIGAIESIANILQWVNNLLSNDIILFGSISTILISIGVHYLRKYELQKASNRAVLEENKNKIEQQKLNKIAEKDAKIKLRDGLKSNLTEKNITKEKIKQKLIDQGTTVELAEQIAQQQAIGKDGITAKTMIAALDKEIAADEAEIHGLQIQELQTGAEIAQNASGIGSIIGGFTKILTPILSIMSLISMFQQAHNASLVKGILLEKEENKEVKKGLFNKIASMASGVIEAFSGGGIPGVIAGIGVAIALAAALGVGIAAATGAFSGETQVDKTAEEINKLSNDIYKLNEKANAIKEVDRKFSALDEKVIKTSKDMKEMNELLDSAKDKLTDEEKAQVNAFKTPQAQMAELRRIEKAARIEADEKRNEQIKALQSLSPADRKKLLTDTDSKSVEAQSAIRAKANNDLYEYIDLLKDEGKILEDNAKATEHITQAILDQMTAEEAAAFAEDPKKTQQLAGLLKDLSATSIFTDDAASLTNRVQAFKDIQVALTADEQAYQKFTEAFSEWDVFKDMSQSALEFIDAAGLSIDEINDLFLGYKKLQSAGVNVSKEDYQTRIKAVFDQVEDDFSNFNSVIEQQFGDLVSKTADGGKQWTALINAIGDQFATSVLDMGQNMEKFKNTISNFYEKSMKWNEMKESEKSQFISDNMDMFKGEGGDELLAAFESGNYNDIEAAIAQQMGKRQADILAEVNRSLAVEMAKPEAEQNKAYIRQLEQYKDFLTDKENLYKVSLKVQLEQEKKQIDEYKSYLQDQQKALEESLDKRKQAYQDYFDKINEQKEEEDFEEETQNLIANIGKLGADTNAATAKERAELVQQLEEKEKQHAEEMRQKAQEAVMKDLDTQVEEINKKFDKLLDSNHELLLAMNGELKDPSKFLGGLLSNKVAAGLTGNEMQNYLQELQGTYGSIIGRDSFEGLEFKERNGDLYLNVNGQEIMLNQNDQQSVFEAITTALRSIGHY